MITQDQKQIFDCIDQIDDVVVETELDTCFQLYEYYSKGLMLSTYASESFINEYYSESIMVIQEEDSSTNTKEENWFIRALKAIGNFFVKLGKAIKNKFDELIGKSTTAQVPQDTPNAKEKQIETIGLSEKEIEPDVILMPGENRLQLPGPNQSDQSDQSESRQQQTRLLTQNSFGGRSAYQFFDQPQQPEYIDVDYEEIKKDDNGKQSEEDNSKTGNNTQLPPIRFQNVPLNIKPFRDGSVLRITKPDKNGDMLNDKYKLIIYTNLDDYMNNNMENIKSLNKELDNPDKPKPMIFGKIASLFKPTKLKNTRMKASEFTGTLGEILKSLSGKNITYDSYKELSNKLQNMMTDTNSLINKIITKENNNEVSDNDQKEKNRMRQFYQAINTKFRNLQSDMMKVYVKSTRELEALRYINTTYTKINNYNKTQAYIRQKEIEQTSTNSEQEVGELQPT